MSHPNPHIVVAISAFRSDDAVLALLNRVESEAWPVKGVVVVDSLGGGELERAIGTRDWQVPVRYENHDVNLGSAGNLRRRLEAGCEAGADFVLALNHDADASREAVEALLAHAGLDRLGALYPLRYREGKGIYDLTGTRDFSFRAHGPETPPDGPLVPVLWSSSNGALYATAPLRERGLAPDPSLWMGWEDYLYGLQLAQHGYRQFIVTDARARDGYEYKTESVAGRPLRVMDKPSWYLYYGARNLLVTTLHEARTWPRAGKGLVWAALFAFHAWSLRHDGGLLRSAGAYLAGVRDGLLNRRGKWHRP